MNHFGVYLAAAIALVGFPDTALSQNDPPGGSASLLFVDPFSLTMEGHVDGPVARRTLSVTSSGAAASFSTSARTSDGGTWLSVRPANATTPAALTVEAIPAGLAVGTYNGVIILNGPANTLVVPVTFTVGDLPVMEVIPSSLTFGYQIGGRLPPAQSLSVASGDTAMDFTVSARTVRGGNWLSASPAQGTMPGRITVGVNPSALAAGTYTGMVRITSPDAGNSPQTVNVTLTVSPGSSLLASPASLSFSFQNGGTSPSAQTVALSTIGNPLNFTVTASTLQGGNWLKVLPLLGTTPASLVVGVDAEGLPPATYEGTISLTASGADPRSVPVTLVVSNTSALSVDPSMLVFNFQIGQANPPVQAIAVTSTAIPLNYTVTVRSEGNWLTAGPPTGGTPSTLSVAANPAGLAPGTYDGTITLTAAGAANSPLAVPVRLTVADAPLLNLAPTALNFVAQFGAANPAPQQVTLSGTNPNARLNLSVSAATQSGAPWLLVSPVAGASPLTLNVSTNAVGLAAGTYVGSIQITSPEAARSQQAIGVTLTITGTTLLVVSPASLTFDGPSPPPQTLSVASTAGALGFMAMASTTFGGNWLSIAPITGVTPVAVNVVVNSSGLEPGVYRGIITIAAVGASNSPRLIPVTLTLGVPQMLSVSPGSLSFSFQTGSPPEPQILSVSATSALNFTASATMVGGGTWLSVNPIGGTTPASLRVSANPAGLATGTYTGSIVVTAPGAANSPQSIPVTLTLGGSPPPSIESVKNAGSILPGAVAPGLIVAIMGSGVGPATPANLNLTGGRVDTRLAGTQVFFDEIPAPLLYVSNQQINAVVPYALEGRASARLQVEYRGVRSNVVNLSVMATQPAVFTANATGRGQGAILNQDLTVNSQARPAVRGSIVAIYATGEGQTDPPGVDGLVTAAIFPRPINQPVLVTIGGLPALVRYAGEAPGLVAGVLQVNAEIPGGVVPGRSVPVVLTIGNNSSQPGVTLAIR